MKEVVVFKDEEAEVLEKKINEFLKDPNNKNIIIDKIKFSCSTTESANLYAALIVFEKREGIF